jgi:1,2-diacylglycerol 3-beta-galactosyltransferase
MPPTILIGMSDTGGGHRAVSRAVTHALEARGADANHIVDLFALGQSRAVGDRLAGTYGWLTRRAPWAWGLGYAATNNRVGIETLALLGERTLVRRSRALLRNLRPALIVSVHGLVTRPLLRALRAERFDIPLVTVIPDWIRAHASWAQPGVAHYTSPTPEMTNWMARLGVPREDITLTGLPVDARFAVRADPGPIRESLGLDRSTFTSLIVSGGEGSGNLPHIVRAIDAAALPLQLIVVCGRNEHARRAVEALHAQTPISLHGFATNMPELMQASDVVVTKGGPQSIAEAFAAGKPVLVSSTLPGQEEGNDAYVERHGAGYVVKRPNRLIGVLSRLSRSPAEVEKLAAGARALHREDAAGAVAELLLRYAAG